MRFLSFSKSRQKSWGVMVGDGVHDIGARAGGSLLSALQSHSLSELSEQYANAGSDFSANEIEYLPPVHAPEKIACIGVNYANRNAEYKDGSAPPKFPSLFMRTPDSLAGHEQALWRPPESPMLDYEGEIVVVIGKEGRRIKESHAFEHIAGLSIMNEGTLRDWVRHAKFNVTQGKNFVRSGSIGPWIVSADEFDPDALTDMRVQTTVNDELRQNDTTANMMFPIAYLISYISTFYHLKPGDVVATGTPNGAGARFDPPKYLVPGDTVCVSVDGVGQLSNSVVDEPIA